MVFHVFFSNLFQIGIQIQKLEPATLGLRGKPNKVPSILNFTVNKTSSDSSSSSTITSPVRSNSRETTAHSSSKKAHPISSPTISPVIESATKRTSQEAGCRRKSETESLKMNTGNSLNVPNAICADIQRSNNDVSVEETVNYMEATVIDEDNIMKTEQRGNNLLTDLGR